jgi:hypothetical protein
VRDVTNPFDAQLSEGMTMRMIEMIILPALDNLVSRVKIVGTKPSRDSTIEEVFRVLNPKSRLDL